MEAVQNVLLVGDRASGLVGIFETKDERPARVSGEQEIKERSACRPDVEWPRGAGRDPNANLGAAGVGRCRGHRPIVGGGPVTAGGSDSAVSSVSAGTRAPRTLR